MNFTHLAAFQAVAVTGSVTAAARRLLVSQPALTREIRDLEERLGIALFDRAPRGMEITDAGRMLLQYSEQIFQLADAAEEALADFVGLTAGTLRIAASRTVGIYLLPPAIDAFHRLYPNLAVELAVTNTDVVVEQLTSHHQLLGFVEGWFDPNVFDARQIGHDELIMVVAASHRLAQAESIRQDRLSDLPVVLRETGSGMRAAVEAAYAANRITLCSGLSLGSAEAIKQLVLLGDALAWVSRDVVRSELLDGSLVALPVQDFRIRRDFNMIWLKGRLLTPSCRAFADLVVQRSKSIADRSD